MTSALRALHVLVFIATCFLKWDNAPLSVNMGARGGAGGVQAFHFPSAVNHQHEGSVSMDVSMAISVSTDNQKLGHTFGKTRRKVMSKAQVIHYLETSVYI